jgi:hypothetical protein
MHSNLYKQYTQWEYNARIELSQKDLRNHWELDRNTNMRLSHYNSFMCCYRLSRISMKYILYNEWLCITHTNTMLGWQIYSKCCYNIRTFGLLTFHRTKHNCMFGIARLIGKSSSQAMGKLCTVLLLKYPSSLERREKHKLGNRNMPNMFDSWWVSKNINNIGNRMDSKSIGLLCRRQNIDLLISKLCSEWENIKHMGRMDRLCW